MLAPAPPNGDLSAGLAGWTLEGREDPVLLSPGVRLRGNTTLVSPPIAVPARAQSLAVRARTPGGLGVLEVRARPEGGGPEIDLAVAETGPAVREIALPAQILAGRSVRLVLDPVPALGTSLDVLGIGPITAPLPGWRIDAGTLAIAGAGATRRVRVGDAPLALTSPPFRLAPRTRIVSVAVRGTGRVRIRLAGHRATALARPVWSLVRIALPRRVRGPVRLVVRAEPGAGALEMRAIGRERPASTR